MLDTLQQLETADLISFLLQMSVLLIASSAILGFTIKKVMHLLNKF